MLAAFTAILVFVLLSLPGWLLVMDRPRPLWVLLAAGFSSQATVILFTALIALMTPSQVDARLSLLFTLALTAAAALFRRGRPLVLPARPELWMFLVPLLATALTALVTQAAIAATDDGLLVRAWFNADGFKHMGHLQSLLHLGLPARDIFGGGERLAYYWLFYIIPATGVALHGDVVGGLVAAGLVQTFAFWVLVYGLLRSAGATPGWAAALGVIGWLGPDLDGLLALAHAGWNFMAAATQMNVEAATSRLLAASGFFRLSFYIPQHQLMLAGLISWGLLASLNRSETPPALRAVALAPLVAAGAVSTMFGLACLGVFGLVTMLDSQVSVVRRLSKVLLVGLLALAVPLLLGVVDLASGSGLDSPIFASDPPAAGPLARLMAAVPGLGFAFGLALLGLGGVFREWQEGGGENQRGRILHFATAALVVGVVVLLATAAMDNRRLAFEMQLRSSLLVWLGLLLGLSWLVRARKNNTRPTLPPVAIVVATPLLLLGLLTPLHDIVWHVSSADRFTVTIPAGDLAVLERLDAEAPDDAVVLQFPELPFVSGGNDIWTSVIAGRMTFASHRSTHFGPQAERLEAAAAFYAGIGPLPAGAYDHVYLSRALHPQSFDLLTARMSAMTEWQTVQCLPDACLYRRL